MVNGNIGLPHHVSNAEKEIKLMITFCFKIITIDSKNPNQTSPLNGQNNFIISEYIGQGSKTYYWSHQIHECLFESLCLHIYVCRSRGLWENFHTGCTPLALPTSQPASQSASSRWIYHAMKPQSNLILLPPFMPQRFQREITFSYR